MGMRRSFKPTNLVVNGDKTSGWTPNNSVLSAANNALIMLASATNGQIAGLAFAITTGKKYYYCAVMKTTTISLNFSIAGASGTLLFPSGSGDFEKLSNVWTSTLTGNYGLRIRDTRASTWDNVYIKEKEVMVIELDAILPANILALSDVNLKAWCDANFPFWFAGTLGGGRIGGIGGLK